MEEIDNLLSKSLDKYFNILRTLGYTQQNNVDNLIILSGLSYILNTFQLYITEEDLRAIYQVLLCISGNCIIDYQTQPSCDSLIHQYTEDSLYRVSQDTVFRSSEDDIFRITD